MIWFKPQVTGAIPKPQQRAHSATLVDNNRLFAFGGGDSTSYFDSLHVLDTSKEFDVSIFLTRRYSKLDETGLYRASTM